MMATKLKTYYVYVYIDPRTLEEFYYGKGSGNRKNAHLSDTSDTEKTRRINAIKKDGLEPIIKVIAKDLTEQEALLVEKTLIWSLGKSLTNSSSGHFAENFRPHDTLHIDLMGFDFKNGIYYVNVGEGDHRCWADSRKYGFLSAGQNQKWSDPIRTLVIGDIIIAYLKKHGYVGVGRVLKTAVPVNNFRYNGKSLRNIKLIQPNLFENSNNEKSEYLVKIEWIKSFDRNEAKWKSRAGLFTSQLIKASLQDQPLTRTFIEKSFNLSLNDLLSFE
jgi:hypothetical protein